MSASASEEACAQCGKGIVEGHTSLGDCCVECKRLAYYKGWGKEEKKQKMDATAVAAPPTGGPPSILPSFQPPNIKLANSVWAELFAAPELAALGVKLSGEASSTVIDGRVEPTRTLHLSPNNSFFPSFEPPAGGGGAPRFPKDVSEAEWAKCARRRGWSRSA
jgi:hypothetical protein